MRSPAFLAFPSNLPLRFLAAISFLFLFAATFMLFGPELTTADQGGPTVTAVTVSSAPSGGAYAIGETIEVTLTFSEAVSVETANGAPRLNVDMDPADWGTKWANYTSGSGTTTLTFAHTVVEPNYSTQGIAVLANTLELNGGTIQSATGVAAHLSHVGLAHDPSHKVDWTPPPSITAVAVSSDAGDDHTYVLDDVIRIRLTFDKPVVVTGTPQLKIDMDPAEWGEKPAAYASGSGTNALTFTHTVVQPNYSTQGIAVLENSLELNGGAIRSEAGADAQLAHAGLPHDANHKVNWELVYPNRAPVVNPQAAEYDDFTGVHNAPHGVLVSKEFQGIFVDPDGDALTYTPSVPDDHAQLVELLEAHRVTAYGVTQDRLFFRADAADWYALTADLPNPLTITATLTATDPEGLSTSLDGDFLVAWEPLAELEAPGKPANLAVSATQGSLSLLATWDDLDGATSYNLRWRQAGGDFEQDAETTVTGASATIVVSSYGEWEVELQGCNDAGCGPAVSSTVDVEPLGDLDLTVATGNSGNAKPRTFTATWQRVPGMTSYELIWSLVGSDTPAGQKTVGGRQTSTDITVDEPGDYHLQLLGNGRPAPRSNFGAAQNLGATANNGGASPNLGGPTVQNNPLGGPIAQSNHEIRIGDTTFRIKDGTPGDDSNLQGTPNSDYLRGLKGDDVLYGLGSADLLEGGDDDDTLHGGEGNDFLSGGPGVDTLLGGNGNDRLDGGAGADTLNGNDGNDWLYGEVFAGFDGPAGDDLMYGGPGHDVLDGGPGADTMHGDPIASSTNPQTPLRREHYLDPTKNYYNSVSDWALPGDTVSYYWSIAGVTVNLVNPVNEIQYGGYAQGDRLFTFDNVIGSRFADQIKIAGPLGHVRGGGGADRLVGALPADYMAVDYRDSPAGVTVALGDDGATTTGRGGYAQGDTLRDFNAIHGSNHADDLTGAHDRKDFLFGNDGDDTLRGTRGPDRLDGGEGSDTADYSATSNPSVVARIDLRDGQATYSDDPGSVSVPVQTLVSIENAIGTPNDDVINGNHLSNILRGGSGDDVLNGRRDYTGRDFLYGDAGNDTLFGAIGSATLDGGSGSDTVTYIDASSSGVKVDLAEGVGSEASGDPEANYARGDRYVNIENVIGSNRPDIIIGDRRANNLQGLRGDDILTGGRGNDTLTGGLGGDEYRFDASFGNDIISDFGLTSDRIYLCMGNGTVGAATWTGADSSNGEDYVITVTFNRARAGTITLEGITSASTNFGNLNILVRDASCREITDPSVNTVAITSTPSHDADNDGVNDTYGQNEVITVSVTFDQVVVVSTTGGTPQIKIRMEPTFGDKWAAYASGSGSTILTFNYTVVPNNISTTGIAVLANTLQENGGSIRSPGVQFDANLIHTGLGHNANHKVDYEILP